MTSSAHLDAAEAVIHPMTEKEWADLLRSQGRRVICHRGRYWLQIARGFYEPVHWLAILSHEEATRPTFWCWGFRARLDEASAPRANGSMPVQLCSNVAGYTEEALPSKRRNDLRRCRKRVRIVQLKDAEILRDQGREVVLSAISRTDHGRTPDMEEYSSWTDYLVHDPRMIVLAGLADDRLAGYLTGYAVGDVAYIAKIFLATEFLPTAIGTGLPFEFMQICRRAGTIRHVVYGLHSIEDPRLCAFKEGMGFPAVYLPIRVSILPVFRTYLRLRYPDKFYRLMGRHPKLGDPTQPAQDTEPS